jgi:4-hydroxy-3-methylbut-2-enyl diphosphate reductase
VLKERFPSIAGPHKEDICYATTNRQEAVKQVAPVVDRMLVVGAPNSSNSQRLREVAERAGAQGRYSSSARRRSTGAFLRRAQRIGVTAGASAPEVIVEEVLDAFAARFDIKVELVRTAEENIVFSLPRQLRDAAAA